jgi:hypothetical protein
MVISPHDRGKRRHLARPIAAVCGSAVALVFLPVIAAASTCAGGTGYYTGVYTNNTISSPVQYDGVEGLISTDSLSLPNGLSSGHDASYVNDSTFAYDCDTYYNQLCWSQNGYQIGDGYGLGVYVESDYYGGYNLQFFPLSQYNITKSATDNNLYQNYLDSAPSISGGDTTCLGHSGLGQFRATLDYGGAIYTLYTSYLDGFFCTDPSAVNEDVVFNTGACPDTPSEEYFGANASGQVSPTYPMSLTYLGNFNGAGFHWFAWTAGNTYQSGHQYSSTVTNSHYSLKMVSQYQTYGVSGS